MENRFYGLDSHIFMAEYDVECADDVQLDDSTLIKQIRQDVRTKDMLSHFRACGQAVPQLPTERRIFPDLCEICLFQPVEGII